MLNKHFNIFGWLPELEPPDIIKVEMNGINIHKDRYIVMKTVIDIY